VFENVSCRYLCGMPGSERKKRVHEALERVGMGHRVKHYPSQLIGGPTAETRWPGAGRRPSILLADEPSGNLGSTNGEAVMELDARPASRRRDHLHGDARSALRALRDRSIHLFDGRIVERTWL